MWYKCQNNTERRLWSRRWVQVAHKLLPEHPVTFVHQSRPSSELGSAVNPVSTPAGPFNSEPNVWIPFSITSISYFLVNFPKIIKGITPGMPGFKGGFNSSNSQPHVPWWFLGNANEALATKTGLYNPNISNGGNAIHYPEFSEAGSEATVGRSNTKLGRNSLIPCEP
jgi:hypothetical protein